MTPKEYEEFKKVISEHIFGSLPILEAFEKRFTPEEVEREVSEWISSNRSVK